MAPFCLAGGGFYTFTIQLRIIYNMDKCVVSRREYYKLFDVVLPESYLLLILDESQCGA